MTRPEENQESLTRSSLYDLAAGRTNETGAEELDELSPQAARYEFKEFIGLGGVKQITRVYDRDLCRDIAMAKVRTDVSEKLRHIFVNGARLTAQLDHPNIIKVHDIGTDENGRLFFTMDLKTGTSLKEWIRQKPEQSDELMDTLEIFIKVCEAIAYAHSKEIIHLDIKPENIQIGQYGEVVVCDWGLGTCLKKINPDDIEKNLFFRNLLLSKPTDDRVTGTPGYMAPEQLSRELPKTKQTDIYGLGALLYTLLKRKPPRKAEPDYNAEPEVASKKVIPEPLEAITMKALNDAPEKRYSSVEELIKDLRLYMAGYTASAEKTGFTKEFGRLLQRNRLLCSVIGTSLIILLTGATLAIVHLKKSHQKEQRARLEAEEAQQQIEEALALYSEEKAARTGLADDVLEILLNQNRLISDSFFYETPENAVRNAHQTMDAVLARHPDNAFAQHHKARLYFITLDFKKADEIYQAYSHARRQYLIAHAKLAAELKDRPQYTQPVSAVQLADIFNKMDQTGRMFHKTMAQMFVYDHAIRTNFDGYEQPLKALIRYYNPKWNPKNFNYIPATKHLDIYGWNLNTVANPFWEEHRSFLSYLPIESLNISNSNISSFEELRGLDSLKTLNISHTSIATAPSRHQLPKLQELILSWGQLSAEQLKSIPANVTIRYR